MASTNTTVIIIGGGVAGLTLSNMLEQAGIDFVLLEKHSQIAADAGAGILVLPPGARILDQLGCYDRLNSSVAPDDGCGPMNVFGPAGEEISVGVEFEQMLMTRYGYGMTFVDRHRLMQCLYDNLKDKSKVLVNKAVVAVEQFSDGVRVFTADGCHISGELLVGADGIHSVVRRQMWELAGRVDPNYFSHRDRTGVCSEYCCIFGISNPVFHMRLRSINHTMGEGYSWVAMNGPEGRIYWFLFSKLPKSLLGLYEKIPRYTEADVELLVQGHLEDRVAENLHFKQLWGARRTTTMTAIPEAVFSKWSYGRITTVGDAAHKFSPIGASAGNSAIETCATLTNHLCQLKMSKPVGSSFSEEELDDVFRRTQAVRQNRVTAIMKRSHLMHVLMSRDGIFAKFVVKWILPLIGDAPLVAFLLGLAKPHVTLEIKGLLLQPSLASHNRHLTSVFTSWYAVAAATAAVLISGLIVVAVHPVWTLVAPLGTVYQL